MATVALLAALGGTGAAAVAQLRNGSVSTATLADRAVTAPKLAERAAAGRKLANASVGSAKLADGAVTRPKLAPAAVGAAQLTDGVVGPGKLAPGAVTDAKLAAGSITAEKLAFDPGGVGGPKLTLVTGTPGTRRYLLNLTLAVATCPVGQRAIAGGLEVGTQADVKLSRPMADGTGWEVAADLVPGATVTATAVCVAP